MRNDYYLPPHSPGLLHTLPFSPFLSFIFSWSSLSSLLLPFPLHTSFYTPPLNSSLPFPYTFLASPFAPLALFLLIVALFLPTPALLFTYLLTFLSSATVSKSIHHHHAHTTPSVCYLPFAYTTSRDIISSLVNTYNKRRYRYDTNDSDKKNI